MSCVVQWRTDGVCRSGQQTQISANTNSLIIDGLVNGTVHTVRVIAANRHDDNTDNDGGHSHPERLGC